MPSELSICRFAQFHVTSNPERVTVTLESIKPDRKVIVLLSPEPRLNILPAAMCRRTGKTIGCRVDPHKGNRILLSRPADCPLKESTTLGCLSKR